MTSFLRRREKYTRSGCLTGPGLSVRDLSFSNEARVASGQGKNRFTTVDDVMDFLHLLFSSLSAVG